MDESPIRKEKVADSKISGYVWLEPKTQGQRFQITPVLESGFEKREDSRPNRRNKTAFSNSYGVVWTGPSKAVVTFNAV